MADSHPAEDRLSNLPGDLLIQILSFLPSIELRAQTSVLSEKWRHLWTSSLSSTSTLPPHRRHRPLPPPLLRPTSSASASTPPPTTAHPSRPSTAGSGFAASRSVNDLVLSFDGFHHHPTENPQLPPSLFLCRSPISSLKLSCCTFPRVDDDFLGFPSLKTLFLVNVLITDEAVDLLISKSPLLQTLNLDCCPEVTRIEISPARNPLIENLKVAICRITESVGMVVVDAPRLRFFDYNGKIEKLKLRDAPRLVGAEVSAFSLELCQSKGQWMHILSAISSVEVLFVSNWFFQLDFYTSLMREAEEQQDQIDDYYPDDDVGPVEVELREDSGEPPIEKDKPFERFFADGGCSLPRLLTATIMDFSGLNEEMQFLRFILQKATNLELLCLTLTCSTAGVEALSKRIYGVPFSSPNLKINLFAKWHSDKLGFKTYQHLWDL
ncbi:F-box/LRR-repeat protein At3g03360-like isoform X2 [Asparagus officinalis]|uniref:F-box/LRR-repeat protein At3g03360-like isoform X2 n=1 Tax=Asparagus officinalis TaxID=4686 RepID=UPI00098E5015|nr:F-box/LRR-repeat protein At3g03360-like isoform X2 [Asparagus officinalis]